jgi:hypothetical protein
MHPSNVDGFLYMSRHVNTEEVLVIFERARKKLTPSDAVSFLD